ncbi:hypothetical protein [Bacillus xiapuensis]|uniref:Uncharacterized protein n=1 Tax=Bacillus xiapuensis TaxID=2014075 RepID=A0ABU6N8K9_9BACI|nr:hypothetical protein [Bacillus xiapuensis]
MKSIRFDDQRVVKKRSRLWKWIKRLLFFILLWLLFLEFNHIHMALAALQQMNADQANLINDLAHKVSSLQSTDINIQDQIESLKIRLNGIEFNQLHNVNTATPIEPHTVTPESIHKASVLHISNPVMNSTNIIVTTAVTVLSVLKGIGSLIPTF